MLWVHLEVKHLNYSSAAAATVGVGVKSVSPGTRALRPRAELHESCCSIPQLNTRAVYVIVHWQMDSIGWDDCVCGPFLLPRHMGNVWSNPDFKRIVCEHNRTVKTEKSITFNLSVPNTACCIPKGKNASASQWRPPFGLKWRKGQRSQWIVTLEYQGWIRWPAPCPSASAVSFGSQYSWWTGPITWGLNSPPQP